MAILWGNQSALAGFQNALALGADIGGAIRQNREDSALAGFMKQPGEESLAKLGEVNPRLAMQAQGQMQQQEAARAKAEAEARDKAMGQLPVMSKLLKYAAQGEAQWSEALSEAGRLGIDVSAVPKQYSPDWANKQAAFADALGSEEGGKALTEGGKYAMEKGLKPGTPEYMQFVNEFLNQKFAQTYTGAGGVTAVRYPDFGGGQSAPQPAAQPSAPRKPVSVEAAMKVVQERPEQAAEFIRNNGFAVQVTSPEQARQLPSGTPIMLPDGTEGVVP